MDLHYGDYAVPKQTGINYTKTIPEVYDWSKWWVGQYPSSSTWSESWCKDVFYNQAARGKPVGPAPDFSYNEPPHMLSQNVMTVDQVSPLWAIAAAVGVYKLIYR
jgi:hypothetical protein